MVACLIRRSRKGWMGSNPSRSTLRWRNGSRAGLRNQCLRTCRFKPCPEYDCKAVLIALEMGTEFSSVGRASGLHPECRQFKPVNSYDCESSHNCPSNGDHWKERLRGGAPVLKTGLRLITAGFDSCFFLDTLL